MATVAELKARLLKYGAANGNSNGKTTPVSTAAPSIGSVHGAGTEQAPIPTKAETTASTDEPSNELSGDTQSRLVPSSTATVEMVVSTELQPTTLVVVERPDELRDAVGTKFEEAAASSTNLDITNPIHQGFLQRLADLETALLERDPLMKTHLGAIHKDMIQYEEIANLLRPEEIAKIMAAQQAHTGMILRVETLSKSKAASNKKAAQLGLNDV